MTALELAPVALPPGVAPRARRPRLVGGELLHAVTSSKDGWMGETVIWSLGAGAPSQRFVLRHLIPTAPDWDCDGKCLVWDEAGGALNQLILRGDGPDRGVSARHADDSYLQPRFVRDAPHFISAHIVADTHPRLVVLSDDGQAIHRLGASDAAVLARHGQDFVVMAKAGIPGEMNRAGASPGVLECARLHGDFTPAGPPSRLLGGPDRVYDFDMVPLGGGRLALVMVTDAAAILAVAKPVTKGVAIHRQLLHLRPGLSFPTVSVSGDHVVLAMMADYGQTTAQILTGKVALADLT